MKKKIFAFFAAAALLLGMSACSNDDNPSSSGQETVVAPAQLKQGIWTEFDTVLVASGKYTMEQLAQMPTVGMEIKGDKGYFFTYTADDISEAVEGQISYDNKSGKGIITFPAIKDNPLSGQSVSFTATTDDMVEFELNYEGQKTTATCAWLCENLDNWGPPATNEEWKELMDYYQTISEDMGPDPSIDWGDLAEPLTWDDGTTAKANTRMVTAVLEGISTGLEIFSSLFEEDPNEVINGKLDAISGKLDEVLKNQEVMKLELNKINDRLVTIAETIDKNTTFGIFNDRNKTYYNPLDVQITKYFNSAYDLYIKNKSDLSKVSADLGDYGKKWVGDGEKYANLTWEYIKYLTTVKHSKYGTGMDKIYDGLTFEKYPWEHMGIGDRKNYRAFDLTTIAKCLFMIDLYSTYGGLDEKDQKGLYNIYKEYKKDLYDFCSFNIADPDKFLVCQIENAHFVMHKELQKYNFKSKCPLKYGKEGAFRPEYHEAGSVKIENPKEVISKLITLDEAKALFKYYKSAFYPQEEKVWWYKFMVEGTKIKDKENNDIEMAGGAVYAMKPSVGYNNEHLLVLGHANTGVLGGAGLPQLRFVMSNSDYFWGWSLGETYTASTDWYRYFDYYDYYMAIVEKRF